MQETLCDLEHGLDPQIIERRDKIKLSTVQIPTFDGQYEHWICFRDLFNDMIYKESSISNVEKMQFLKTLVKGEAQQLIQHLSVCDANYKTEWEALNQRFNNKRLLVNTYLEKIFKQVQIQQESSDDIKKLHDTTQEN